ncbi:MAG TPA: amino acid ABC transporter substrate-binding protein [Candidatus Acidoferrales bacterium]|nr:amino acid ABC transporter substrate-binding protein [Candidatus Acidoferrales bacterium]
MIEKLTVGMSISLSGRLRLQAEQALRGVKLWVDYVTQRGGIYLNERARHVPVELVAYDDKSEVEQAKKNVARLIKEDRVDLLFGPYSSHLTLAVAPIAETHRKILWNHGGATDTICRQASRHVVSVLSPASSYLRALPAYLAAREPASRRLVCLTPSSGSFAAHVARGLMEAAEPFGLAFVRIPFDSPADAIARCEELILSADADVLVAIGSFADDVKIAKHFSGAKQVVAVAAGVHAFGQALGKKAEGIVGPSQWEPGVRYPNIIGPGAEWFSAVFQREFGVSPDYPAAQAFAAGVVIEETIRRAGGLDDERLLEALGELYIRTFYGAFHVDRETGRQTGHEVLLVRWEKGKKVVIWPLRGYSVSRPPVQNRSRQFDPP